MYATVTSGALLFVLGAAAAGAQPGGAPDPLFLATEPQAAPLAPEPGSAVLRQRFAHIDREVLEAARLAAGRGSAPVLLLNLFSDTEFRVVVTWTAPTSSGYSLSGYPEEWKLGSLTLVANGDIVVGTVRVRAATYSIRTIGSGVIAIRQVDPLSMERQGDDVAMPPTVIGVRPDRIGPIRTPSRVPDAAAPSRGGREDGSQIDVLVVYTPAARAAWGSRRRIEAAIDLQAADVNQAYRQSGVVQRIRVVHTAEVAYRERGRSSIDVLEHLRGKGDGYMDRVHALRDQYAADIVSLRGGGSGGVHRLASVSRSGRFQTSSLLSLPTAGHSRTNWGTTWACNTTGTRSGKCVDPSACVRSGRFPTASATPTSGRSTTRRRPRPKMTQCGSTGVAGTPSCLTTLSAPPRRVECYPILRFSNPDRVYSLGPGWGDDLPLDRGGVPGTRRTSSISGPSDARRTLNRTRRAVANWAPGTLPPRRRSDPAAGEQWAVPRRGGERRRQRAREPVSAGPLDAVDGGGCQRRVRRIRRRRVPAHVRRLLPCGRGAAAGRPWTRRLRARRPGRGSLRAGNEHDGTRSESTTRSRSRPGAATTS